MAITFDSLTGEVKIKELYVDSIEGVYYSDELTALKEKILPLVDAVQEARAAYLTAIYNVDQDNKADVKAVEEKEAELAELQESKSGVLVALELLGINKAEKKLKAEIEAMKEINVTLADNRKVIYEDAAEAVFTALEAYKPVLDAITVEYAETKSERTADVYDHELKQFEAVYLDNGKYTFRSLAQRIQPVYKNNMGIRKFGIDKWRGHSLLDYERM